MHDNDQVSRRILYLAYSSHCHPDIRRRIVPASGTCAIEQQVTDRPIQTVSSDEIEFL